MKCQSWNQANIASRKSREAEAEYDSQFLDFSAKVASHNNLTISFVESSVILASKAFHIFVFCFLTRKWKNPHQFSIS